MAALVMSHSPQEIISKGTFTLNVRVKREKGVEEETSFVKKLDNTSLQNKFKPLKKISNISLKIQDNDNEKEGDQELAVEIESPMPVKKVIKPIIKKSNENTGKKKPIISLKESNLRSEVEVEPDVDLDNLGTNNIDTVNLEGGDVDEGDVDGFSYHDSEPLQVRKMRVMGSFFWVGIGKPYIYCPKTFEKIGYIKDNRDIDWYD